ncbi:MAG: 3'-to-5' exoribonuclease RNase R [uncultured Aureispira sp.]|uniref:Ribonuclease R n=1 Tax=uncultured Aureispira sp. TaxID=1331704 RepID=A0A6S6ULQ6_9BACT|nr:MAG: 3'-to-5' exoribonuclease RNase R [uncultured Aureispira sp.]
MTKKKKGSKKGKNLPVHLLEKKIIDLFSKQVTSRFDAKGIIGKLRITNSRDSVQHTLDQLVKKGKIEEASRGKYKWNKAAKMAKTNTRSDAKIATGRVDATRSGAAYIISEDLDNDIFVPAHKLMGALNGDTVEVSWYLARKDKLEGQVVQITERKSENFIGTLSLSDKFAFVIPDNQSMQTDIFVALKNLPKGAEDGAKVVVNIIKWATDNKNNPEGKVTTYFGTEGGNDIEMKSILIQKGFNLTFPPEVLKENAAIDTEVKQSEINKRRDMREITTFTIDPASAKDFDDALSLELLENGNYEIGIHIADVGHYVVPGSELDKEAAKRTTSVYLVDRVLPMLPEKLSNGVCSLRPEEEKLTFSAVFEMDKQGTVLNEWFGKTAIYSDRRFTYEEAQERLETGEGDYAQELQLINGLAHKLRAQRFKKGAINFESPEVRFKLDEKGVPLEVYLKSRKDAHMLVEDFMLLANKRVGALIHGLHEKTGIQWPMVYRIHDEPDMDRVQSFADFAAQMGYKMKVEAPEQVKKAYSKMLKEAEGKPEADILQQLAIRTMSKAVYSSDNIGHYGLGFETYSHFTSPIRRYADVLGHRILFDYLSDTNKRMDVKKLEELCKHISRKERDAMEAERESVKYKQAEFLEAHVGENFEGSISGIADHGIYVSIKANFCEGMIRYERMFDDFTVGENKFQIKSPSITYRMGDSVWVRVLGANKYKKQIDLELLDPEDEENRPPVRAEVKELTFAEQEEMNRAQEAAYLATKKAEKDAKEAPIAKKETTEVAKEEAPEVIKEATSEVSDEIEAAPEPIKKPRSEKKKVKVVQEPKKGKKDVSSKYNAKNAPYEALLPAVKKIFNKSDVKHIAIQKKAKWQFEITPSAPVPESVLLLRFNPEASLNKGYRGQKLISKHPFKPEGSTRVFFKTYFPYEKVSEGYLSPLRSLDDKQLSAHDIELGLPIFEDFIKLLNPKQVVSFSAPMIATLQKYKYLTDIEEEEVTDKGRTIISSRAILTIGELKIPIFFVPRPSSRLLKELKSLAWDWAFGISTNTSTPIETDLDTDDNDDDFDQE